ncbi:hypothetical protein [Rhizobium sp.]|uniref:hypothetical protein n=1 Tax=Rhizobium sp. TaxID=391 RepID=UPI002EEE4D70
MLIMSVALAIFSLGWSVHGALRGSLNAMVIWLGFSMFFGLTSIMYSMVQAQH